MWLLESDLFEGRELWLRPGKLYLFGRTAAEPGQLAISDKTISRKHITIQVDNVPDGGGRNIRSRSTVTIEDLDSKKGTLLNDVQIRGQKKTLSEDVNEVKLGMCSKPVRIRWNPVVLSFSFTTKELLTDPWIRLRDSLEQLDIKYSAEYGADTTHVVSKKRNTSKGLQALINGKYLVADTFINAIVDAATIPDEAEEGTSSALEEDFEASWPNAIDHLPPRGEELVERSSEVYSPDDRREEVFDGYTFVFYERKQYENLFPVISAGKGKALLREVTAGETDVDDFIRYVKGVAGEKGLGFGDGNEGRGVVVVRYTPKTEDSEWFAQFLTSFAQRLDHQPINQREFLEAILACDASMLRRPPEEASQLESRESRDQGPTGASADRMDIDEPAPQLQASDEPATEQEPAAPGPRRGRDRRAGRSRFKGFDFDDAEEPVEETPPSEPSQPPQVAAASQDSLFVSQHQESSLPPEEEVRDARPTRRTQRKRALSPLPEHDNSALMDEIAPTAAAAKRRRIESGQAPVPPPPEPEPEPLVDEDEEMIPDSPQGKPKKGQAAKGKGKKVKEEDDILELARRQREEAEALAAAKRRKLEDLPDDGIDYAAIRALHIIEECKVHFPEPGGNSRSRDQDIVDGRWDPQWNGRKNFKRFRKQGEATGRPAPRIIISLEEVRPKEYGIGDEYWLEEEGSGGRKKDSQRESQTQTPQLSQGRSDSLAKGKEKEKPKPALRRTVLALDSSDEEEPSELSTMPEDSLVPETEPSRSRAAKAAERANSQRGRTQTQTQSQSQAASSSKRSAPTDSAREPAAKRPRRGFKPPSDDDSDDSDDELKFRFGRRR
ncbi:hypothetical protein C8A00DRAFT_33901 [Chaetomidium leptoderma]|uniref:FHA domain-containing protein n=1 Tax=Chaetomidium leptoderma TaxID=669021 RepID=A0AAN6VKR0_9PEZI|nr:hypothetical protein C8A00DRAFT_33901 [Chaetomidium leptoderma]